MNEKDKKWLLEKMEKLGDGINVLAIDNRRFEPYEESDFKKVALELIPEEQFNEIIANTWQDGRNCEGAATGLGYVGYVVRTKDLLTDNKLIDVVKTIVGVQDWWVGSGYYHTVDPISKGRLRKVDVSNVFVDHGSCSVADTFGYDGWVG